MNRLVKGRTITLDKFVKGIITVAIVVSVVYLIHLLSNVLLPFFIAWLIAYLLHPIVNFMQKKLHVPSRALSIIITLAFIMAIVVGVAMLIVPSIVDQCERLTTLTKQYLHQKTNISNIPLALQQWIEDNKQTIREWVKDGDLVQLAHELMPSLFVIIDRTAGFLISIIVSLVTLIYLFFILLDYDKLVAGFIKMAPRRHRRLWRDLILDVERALNNYIRGQSLVALCITILLCIGFSIINFPMAIVLGILIGIMSLIPYLHGLGIIPICFLSLLKAIDTGNNFWLVLLSALIVFAVVQIITDAVLNPLIMGKAMHLNPAILLLSLSIWGSLLGLVGLIIALPLTTILIAYYKRYVL